MKPKPLQKWIPLVALTLGLAPSGGLADSYTNIFPRPAAMQPNGDPNDTTRNFGVWWTDTGTATEAFDSTMHSSNNIAGSIKVTFDCPGNTGDGRSANLAYGNFLDSFWGDNGWLGAGTAWDASRYEKLIMDIYVDTLVSSNTTIPINLYGGSYGNVNLTNLAITNVGWQHLEIPISPTINLPDCTAYGTYEWYNTTSNTPPAHVEYWFDNVMLKVRPVPPPPPTLSMTPVTRHGLLLDSALGEGGQRGAIQTATDVRWTSGATPSAPVTYAMTISWLPDPTIYSNYDAHIFLAPNAGVGSPDWNLPDMGELQILANSDGTATARMMWKTNDANDNTMLFNELPGGEYGTNGYAAGTLGRLTAPTMLGTWSISFTGFGTFVVRGPGGVSTNFTLPDDWVSSFTQVNSGQAYAYFGGGPNGNNNAGQPMYLSQVAVSSQNDGYALTNRFTSLPLDTTVWTLLGNETALIVPQMDWRVGWNLPAVNFNLWTKPNLTPGTPWTLLSGNTNLSVPVTSYISGTNVKAYVASTALAGGGQNYFELRKLAATKLQVLMPGESNAPFTATGKTGTPDQQPLGALVNVTVNAVDVDWNVVTTCTDTIAITSSDPGAALPPDTALANGTYTFQVFFGTPGTQTVTATDVTTPTVSPNTGSNTTVTP